VRRPQKAKVTKAPGEGISYRSLQRGKLPKTLRDSALGGAATGGEEGSRQGRTVVRVLASEMLVSKHHHRGS